MPNTDLIDVLTEYDQKHKALIECMNTMEGISMNPAQRAVFRLMREQESIHALLIDSFTKPGSFPWYWHTGENPAASGSLGMTLPNVMHLFNREEDDEDTE